MNRNEQLRIANLTLESGDRFPFDATDAKDGLFRRYKTSELDLLAETLRLVYGPVKRET